MNDSEQTEGEYLTALGFFEPFPFQLLITFAATNAGWNMVVLQRCRLQYSLFRPILPSLHRPLGALGSNPPQAGTALGWWLQNAKRLPGRGAVAARRLRG